MLAPQRRRALVALALSLPLGTVACSTSSASDAGGAGTGEAGAVEAGAVEAGVVDDPNRKQYPCPNGSPGSRADYSPAVCSPQKTETFYTCPQNAPASVCFVVFTYACGLPPGTGPLAGDAGDAGAYDCAALCPQQPGPCSVAPVGDGGPVVRVRCGSSVCGA